MKPKNGLLLALSIFFANPTLLQANVDFVQQLSDTQTEPNRSVASDKLEKGASWSWPDASRYSELLASYLDVSTLSADEKREVERFWQASERGIHGPALLERLLDTAGFIEPRIAKLNQSLRSAAASPVAPGELNWLTSDVPGWLQDTIRLACGRAYCQKYMYDESLEILSGLELTQVCDPSTLLFYRATCQHHLLQKDECLKNVRQLLERSDELPARYSQIGKLLEADIEPLKKDSLDEIARMMTDVRRRLDLGRAGQKVRSEEQAIVDKLEKLIEDMEEQLQQAQAQSGAGAGGGSNPNQGQGNPMEDSQIAGGSGPGDIDNKRVGDRSGWGNLPPAERQEALQRLTEELPSHYRDVIEGYFRELARDRG